MDSFYRAINKSEPSFIRVEADEVTYNLHIFLRFELEQALLEKRLDVADLPEAWNTKMEMATIKMAVKNLPGVLAICITISLNWFRGPCPGGIVFP